MAMQLFFAYGYHKIHYCLVRHFSFNLTLGVYDGHEIVLDNSDGSFYMYGPNAEAMFIAIKPTLEQATFMQGAEARLEFGVYENGPREITVKI